MRYITSYNIRPKPYRPGKALSIRIKPVKPNVALISVPLLRGPGWIKNRAARYGIVSAR